MSQPLHYFCVEWSSVQACQYIQKLLHKSRAISTLKYWHQLINELLSIFMCPINGIWKDVSEFTWIFCMLGKTYASLTHTILSFANLEFCFVLIFISCRNSQTYHLQNLYRNQIANNLQPNALNDYKRFSKIKMFLLWARKIQHSAWLCPFLLFCSSICNT